MQPTKRPAPNKNIKGRFERPFLKMQGLGNHFVIVDGRATPFQPPVEEIIRICDEKTGIGAEQLLVIEPPTDQALSLGANARMRIYNPDGAEAQACGNATRCVVYLLLEETRGDIVQLETMAGILEGRRAGELSVSVNMGRISTDWESIPLSRPTDTLHAEIESGPLQDATVLNIGNPHAVFFVDDLQAVDLERFAPAIQADPLFPESVNVGAAELVDETSLRLSVYERPGVLTTACGSGSCVAVYAAHARGLTNALTMAVEMQGGTIQVQLNDDGTATMTGPVAYSFEGTL